MILEILAAGALAGEPVVPAPVAPVGDAATVFDSPTPRLEMLTFVVDEAGLISQCQFYSGPIANDADSAKLMQAHSCPPDYDSPYYDADGRPVSRRVTISRTVQLEDVP